jgi:hypothetical protein
MLPPSTAGKIGLGVSITTNWEWENLKKVRLMTYQNGKRQN